ncbi:MAG TPA: glycoside hydrolase family 130 protein [Candidatus Limnocylindrales bacterium]|nr:glycoside hydrolase family 130 protein [Candidatus Limnocylindrales bacterium]
MPESQPSTPGTAVTADDRPAPLDMDDAAATDGVLTPQLAPRTSLPGAAARAPIPWEDRPAAENGVLWRSSRNPIIRRDHLPRSNSIFNSAVVPHGGGFAGIFRVDDRSREMNLHAGRSRDGIDWDIEPEPIRFHAADGRVAEIQAAFEHAYDPRVTWLEDRYYVTWCSGYHGPTIGIGYTHDFETFHQLDNAFLPFNRNGVLFPRRVGAKYAMLSRPSDNGHTPFGDIFVSESPDLVHWGRHRHVLAPEPWTWQSTKIGAGPTPIETSEGWLLIYHGVLTSANGFVYSMGAALLDLERPWQVIARGRDYLLSPQVSYEQVGDVPNVVFPCAAVLDSDGERITIYYGAADTVVCIAHGYLSEILASIR